MFWSLWTEGLATYGSYEITGKTDMVYLMGYAGYKNYSFNQFNEVDKFLATEFLKVHDDALVDFKDMSKNKKWFGGDSTPIRKDLPPAVGYYLGFRVIQQLIAQNKFTFQELIKKSPNELQVISQNMLAEMVLEN